MKYKLVDSKLQENQVKNINIKKSIYSTITLSFGTILITTTFFSAITNTVNENSKNHKIEMALEEDSNYDLENELKNYDITIDSNYIDDIDWFCSYIKLIDKYNRSEEQEKYSIKDKLLKDYNLIEQKSLELLKKKVASENSLNPKHIKIYVGRNGTKAIIGKNEIKLEDDESYFARRIADFQGYNPDGLRSDDSNTFNIYMNQLKELALSSVKLIDDEKDYNISSFIGYVR